MNEPTPTSGPDAPPALPTDPRSTCHGTNPTATSGWEEAARAGAVGVWSIVSAETVGGTGGDIELGASGVSYGLIRRIASGGMGEVWEARQEALERVVAVKRVREDRLASHGGSEARAMLADFRREALVAANLEHPNIVPIHDFGTDSGGNPVLAMKLVRGDSWDRMIARDWKDLEADDFLGRHLPVLVAVAQAVAFAHSRGIVHRDLKPSQVMVGEFGEVMLMDWGLAVRVEPAESTGETGTAMPPSLPTPDSASSPAGTPALMAPEQTRGSADKIGPWTDVYLLGGTLYFLLTGTFPHDAPSSRESFSLAANGEVEPVSVRAAGRGVPAELAELAMLCLEAEHTARKATAREVVAGLQDYLTGASQRGRARELAERAARQLETAGDYDEFTALMSVIGEAQRLWPANPRIGPLLDAAHAAQAGLALSQGDLALAAVQARTLPDGPRRRELHERIARLTAERRRRKSALRAAVTTLVVLCIAIAGASLWVRSTILAKNAELEERTADAERRQAIAMAQFEGAGSLVGYMLGEMHTVLDLTLPHDQEVARAVAKGVDDYYRRTNSGSFDRPLLEAHLEQVTEVSRQFHQLGLLDEAYRHGTEALAMSREMHGPDSGAFARALEVVGMAEKDQGKLEEARARLAEALAARGRAGIRDSSRTGAILDWLGFLDMRAGHHESAEAFLLESLALKERHLGPDHADTAHTALILGQLERRLDRLDDAEVHIRRALEIWDKQHGRESARAATALSELSTLAMMRGRLEESLKLQQQAVDTCRQRLGPTHPQLAVLLSNLAQKHAQVRQMDQARALLEEAIAINEGMFGREHPLTLTFLHNLAWLLNNTGESRDALAITEEVLQLRRETIGELHPDTIESVSSMADTLQNLKRYGEAREYAELAVSQREQVNGPASSAYAVALNNHAQLLREMGELEAALAAQTKSNEVHRTVFGPGHMYVYIGESNLGQVLRDLGRLDEAEERFQLALEKLVGIVGPQAPNIAGLHKQLSSVDEKRGDLAAAAAHQMAARDICLATLGPLHRDTLDAVGKIADCLFGAARLEGPESPHWQAILDVLSNGEQLAKLPPPIHAVRALALHRTGSVDAARAAAEQLLRDGHQGGEEFGALVEELGLEGVAAGTQEDDAAAMSP